MKKSLWQSVQDGNLSASDDGFYPEVALKAALNSNDFNCFRQNKHYRRILEHTSLDQAHAYFDKIRSIDESELQILDKLTDTFSGFGSPVLDYFKPLGKRIPLSLIRYFKIGIDIKTHLVNNLENFQSKSLKIVEIGCGYGGQALVLSELLNISDYTFVDLWQVNLLITRVMELDCPVFQYSTHTLNTIKPPSINYDIVVSNYAFSELSVNLQNKAIANILQYSTLGYMIMNNGLDGNYGTITNYSQDQLSKRIEKLMFIPEEPKTGPSNYIAIW
jgi:hypothetical protein